MDPTDTTFTHDETSDTLTIRNLQIRDYDNSPFYGLLNLVLPTATRTYDGLVHVLIDYDQLDGALAKIDELAPIETWGCQMSREHCLHEFFRWPCVMPTGIEVGILESGFAFVRTRDCAGLVFGRATLFPGKFHYGLYSHPKVYERRDIVRLEHLHVCIPKVADDTIIVSADFRKVNGNSYDFQVEGVEVVVRPCSLLYNPRWRPYDHRIRCVIAEKMDYYGLLPVPVAFANQSEPQHEES